MVTYFCHFKSDNPKVIFFAKMSTTNRIARRINSGALKKVENGLGAKIRKNTIPFQAKAKERNTVMEVFAL